HTEASGYGLTASARRQGRRLLLVVNGLNSSRERASEASRVLDWGFRATKIYRLFKKGEQVGEADTWLGKEGKVPLIVDKNITITMPRLARANMKVKLIFNNPIPAPVSKGTVVGHVLIKAPGIDDIQIPVKTALHAEELGFFGRINAAIKYLLYGKLGS
ncbi:MAG: D-alanyl-D-alanine carboxypeptidase, partial [Pseudomonadota bacterium]|nr:D-alanyl-D-alanine carboxypeptidase [Pseudomonadota bacterium]